MGDRIRVRYFEAAFLQIVAVIEQRSADKERTLRIDDYADIGRLHHDVAIRGAIDEVHFVLQPGAPPPITATRSAPVARPCFSRSELSLRDAFSVTLIRRSLPIL